MPVDPIAVAQLAPKIYFHEHEQYLPCSIEHLLAHASLKDLSPTRIWNQATSIPAMAYFNGALWMIYTDSKSSQLWATSSTDGLNWDDAVKLDLPGTSVPALATFNNKLWMAYTGAHDSQIVVTSSPDGVKWDSVVQIGQQTSIPAMVEFNGALWMVYTDANGSDIYVTHSLDGSNWLNAHTIGQNTSVPAIAVFNNQLWMAYSDANNSNIWVTHSDNGDDWLNPHTIGQNTSVPALAAYHNQLWMIYSDANNSNIWVTHSDNGDDWLNPHTIGQNTSVPAVAVLGADKYLCVTYTDAKNSDLWATISQDGDTWHRDDIVSPTQDDLYLRSETVYFLDIAPSQYAGEGLQAPMYYAVQEFPSYTEITYLILCAFNGPQAACLPLQNPELYCTVANYACHPGDIERVTVRFTNSATGLIVQRVTVEQHGNPQWVAAANIDFDGTHPLIYSALNSHATFVTKNQDLWNADTNLLVVQFGDAMGNFDDVAGSSPSLPVTGKCWTPVQYVLVGLDAQGEPVGDQKWAKFPGRLGAHVENDLTDGRHFDGSGLSDGDWSAVKALKWAAGALGKIDEKMKQGDGPWGLGQPARAYMRPPNPSVRTGLTPDTAADGADALEQAPRWVTTR